jgi:flagellar biosynthesis protein FlhF
MEMKRYRAATLREALDDVKREMGTSALIISTEKVRQEGILGLFGKDLVEVTAAAGSETTPERRAPVSKRQAPAQRMASAANAYAAGARTSSRADEALPSPSRLDEPLGAQLVEISRSLGELRQMYSTISSGRHTAPRPADPRVVQQLDEIRNLLEMPRSSALFTANTPAMNLLQRLIESGVDERLANRIVESCQLRVAGLSDAGREALAQVAHQALSRALAVTGDLIEQNTRGALALVGPTGVGKTTTIAKLAARAVARRKSVALISIDTFRIGAAEQLRIYARILGVPYHVVDKPVDIRRALASHADKDLILIDTIGSSPRDSARLDEMTPLIRADPQIQPHLVLAINTRSTDLARCREAYSRFSPKSLIFTKLDESNASGVMLDTVVLSKMAISYICFGQNVPEDIAPAVSADLARLILEQKLERVVPLTREVVA